MQGAIGPPTFSSDRYINKIFDGRRSNTMNKTGIISHSELAYLCDANMSLGSFTKGGLKAQSPASYKPIHPGNQYVKQHLHGSLDASSAFMADNTANFKSSKPAVSGLYQQRGVDPINLNKSKVGSHYHTHSIAQRF